MLLNINFSKLLSDALPTMLRKPKILAWMESLLKPVKVLYQDYSGHVTQSRTRLAYNSQTIVFESSLNDLFDAFARRIWIENNPEALEEIYLYNNDEAEPDVLLYDSVEGESDLPLHASMEYAVPLGFVVHASAAISAQDKALRTFIEKIKFAHIRYEIIYDA